MTAEPETIDITIETPDGNEDVTLPEPLFDVLANGDESNAEVAGDILVLSCAQRVHALVHHGEGEIGAELESVEDEMLSLFEARFGVSFAEATGHSH